MLELQCSLNDLHVSLAYKKLLHIAVRTSADKFHLAELSASGSSSACSLLFSDPLLMAKAAEDMGFDDLAAACDGYMCRALPTPLALAPSPPGAWNRINFPMTEVESAESNPSVHYLDVVRNYQLDVAFADLEVKYKTAIPTSSTSIRSSCKGGI